MILAALIGRSVARARALLLSVALLLAAFQVAVVLQATRFDQRQLIEGVGRMIPAFLQRWLGEAMFTLTSFSGLVSFGYFHPIIVLTACVTTAFIASDPAADVEEGYVDLLLARSVSRHWLITRSALLLVLVPCGLAAVMMCATLTSAALVAPSAAERPSAGTIALLAAHLVGVAWCFGSLALALSSGARRRASAFAGAALAAVTLYLVNVLAASWSPARLVDVVSPFHYFQGTRILASLTNPTRDLAVLATATIVLVATAFVRFRGRDL